MKLTRTVLVCASLATLFGCGGEGEPSVEETGEFTAELTNQLGAPFSVNQWDSYIQQVPVQSHRLSSYTNGTIYSMTEGTWRATVYQDSQWNNNQRYIGLTMYGSNASSGIMCSLKLVRVTATNMYSGEFFPAAFALPGSEKVKDMGAFWVNGESTGACRATGGEWVKTPSFVWVRWSQASFTTTGPTDATHIMHVRIDLDFPEFGVTNRYFTGASR